MFTIDEITRLRSEIHFYQLQAPYRLQEMTDTELQQVCNGVGPDRYPKWVRKALNALAGPYTVISVPHDVRYHYHIGTQETADSEFYSNGLKIHKHRWGWRRWISPAAWREKALIKAAYIALYNFGDAAWEKKEEKEKSADV